MADIFHIEDRKRDTALSWLREGSTAFYKGAVVTITGIAERVYFTRRGSTRTESADVEELSPDA